MTYFRNFTKTICASNFTRPNNYLLVHTVTPTFLCTSNQPSIEHLNTLKSLFRTVDKLEKYKDDVNYKGLVGKELDMLRTSVDGYVSRSVRYVENGGRLTAQALANLYAYADRLNVNSRWLETYAQSQIPNLIRYMSIDSLKDIQAGLKKYNGSAQLASLVDKQITNRGDSQAKYVKRVTHQIAQFQQVTNPYSQNLLLNSLERKQSSYLYYARKAWRLQTNWLSSYLRKPFGYQLD